MVLFVLATSPEIEEQASSLVQWGQETGVLWIGGMLAVLLLLHLLASWAEKKGWIYYRTEGGKGRGVALSNAMSEFEAVLNPAAEHRIEEERSQHIAPTQIDQNLLGPEDSDGSDPETLEGDPN